MAPPMSPGPAAGRSPSHPFVVRTAFGLWGSRQPSTGAAPAPARGSPASSAGSGLGPEVRRSRWSSGGSGLGPRPARGAPLAGILALGLPPGPSVALTGYPWWKGA
jgi:hypothetical protein